MLGRIVARYATDASASGASADQQSARHQGYELAVADTVASTPQTPEPIAAPHVIRSLQQQALWPALAS